MEKQKIFTCVKAGMRSRSVKWHEVAQLCTYVIVDE